MSVYIRGMDMPPSCRYCEFRHLSLTQNAFCTAAHSTIDYTAERTKRLDNCPLIPVPDHGRLIDADAFREEMDKHYPFDKLTQSKHREADAAKSTILVMLTDAPTIIPAEEVEE